MTARDVRVTAPTPAPVVVGTSGVAAADPAPLMSEGRKILFSLAGVCAILLSVTEEYLVSTAGIPIIRHLDPGASSSALPWLLTTYALASTAVMPLLGAMCDSFGIKKVYLTSIWIFLVGSVLCGCAQTMPQLLAARVFQGIGGGGLMSVTLVALSSLYPPRERAGSGLGSSFVGFGIVLGPVLGGVITDNLSWRWVFLGNLVLGVPVAIMVHLTLKLPPVTTRRRIDVSGSSTIVLGTSALLLAAQWAGTTYHWFSPQIIGLGVAAVAMFVGFAVVQSSGRSQMLPPWLFRIRVFRLALPLEFLGGFALLVTPVYLSAYLQVVRGFGPTKAGVTTAFLVVGLVTASVVGGKILVRTGRFHHVLGVNIALGVCGLGQLVFLGAHSPFWSVWLALVMLGVALGGVLQVVMLAVQVHTPPERIGTVTVNLRFVAFLGQASGAAILGAVIAHRMAGQGVSRGSVDLGELALPGPQHAHLIGRYLDALHVSFALACVALLVGLVFALRMPARRLDLVVDADDADDDADDADVASASAGDERTEATDVDIVADDSVMPGRHRAAA